MNAKGLLYFLGGAIFGGGLTFLLIKEKYKEEADQAIDEVKKYYKKLEDEKEVKTGKTLKGDVISINAKNVGADQMTTSAMTAYTTLYSGNTEEEPEDDEEDEDDYENVCPSEPVSHPYVIDEASFVNEKSYYDKIGLFYYQGNNVVTSENYEPIADWEDLIGPDIGARFRLQDRSDERFEYIYIRNDSIGSDYEICLKRESFN